MILKRGFVDAKKLATSAINRTIRTPWLLDYVKCLVKPFEYSNNSLIKTQNMLSEYTLYNGQKLVLKTFIDDYNDFSGRTIITENKEEQLSLYGSYNGDVFVDEVDPNPTSIDGYAIYSSTGYTFVSENLTPQSIMYGYIKYESFEALQDVDDEYIIDNYDEFIYTAENDENGNRYIYFLESQSEEGLIIYLHEEIYNNMTEQELKDLFAKLGKYIQQPIRYKIDSYV